MARLERGLAGVQTNKMRNLREFEFPRGEASREVKLFRGGLYDGIAKDGVHQRFDFLMFVTQEVEVQGRWGLSKVEAL